VMAVYRRSRPGAAYRRTGGARLSGMRPHPWSGAATSAIREMPMHRAGGCTAALEEQRHGRRRRRRAGGQA
jgi:hypothetical protein